MNVTTKADIRRWLEQGKGQGATHMVVLCDTYDWSDYPVYVTSETEARATIAAPGEMQKVMEVYRLDMDWDAQLNERRAFNY